jgi:uncharacterized protein YabE (DUF348 family)
VLRSIKYGVNGAVLAGLIAVPVAVTSMGSLDKTVNLVVDGHSTTVHTTAHSVGDVLHSRGYHVTSHDLVAPAQTASVKDGSRIVLRRGRLLHLNVDGRAVNVWTTAPTVNEALGQLGYAMTDFVSVSRARRLPLSPTDIAIRTPRMVTVVHDGSSQEVSTTDATVGELLADLGITVGADDHLSAAPSAPLVPNETLQIQRGATKLLTKIEAVPFPTRQVRDSGLTKGQTSIVDSGRRGKLKVTYSVVYLDGKVVGRTRLRAVTLAAPQPRVVKIGTKPVNTTAQHAAEESSVPDAPAPSPGTAKAIAKDLLAKRGWGSDQYDCLVTLWNHESGWRVHAANPSGAYGIPQALPGSKMASAGPDWQNNAETQIKWGLGYIAARYNTPCGAWSTWQAHGGWY